MTLTWWLIAAEAVALLVVAPQLWRSARGGRRLQPQSVSSVPTISVVIPARNEAGRIAECLRPLHGADGVVEVIVVDDESTDHTAQVARDLGARVIRGETLPEGWVGKIWALQQGIAAANGEVVVTLDADARPDGSLPRAAAEALGSSGVALATVATRFRTTSAPGQWLHAAMLTSLVYRHGAGSQHATPNAVANGQCMVFRRDDALQGGWCERVRGSTIEDVALVRCLVADGARVEMFDGSHLLAVEMFDGFVDTWRGWGRSIALGGVDQPTQQVLGLATTALTLVAPIWLFAFGVATPLTGVLLLVRLGTLFGARRAYETPGFGYWLSPLADALAWLVVLRGTVAPSREWRGRKY